jgi:hypothetical protein
VLAETDLLRDMKAVFNFFLKAKHWQVFLLLFAVPTIAEIAASAYIPTTIRSWKDFGYGGLLYLGLMLLDTLCLFAWLWAMGSFLNSLQNPARRLNQGFFRVALVYPFIYMPFFFWFLLNSEAIPVQVVFPLHLFATLCFFYVFYFVAKNLVTVNKRKEVFIGDYAKSWILLCLFPIGVWFIQPRINQLYTEAMNR